MSATKPAKSDNAKAIERMVLMTKATKTTVARIIQTEGEGFFEVEVQGGRLVVHVDMPRVSEATAYRVSGLISSNLEFLMTRIFKDMRFRVHHTVNVNGRRLAYSR